MGDVKFGLVYWLPRTQFTVWLTERREVRTEAGRSELKRIVDVRVSPSVAQDHAFRQELRLDAKFLEKIAVAITLDDRGFIQSINSESGRDVTPVLDLVAKVIPLAVSLAGFTPKTAEPSLEDKWTAAHATLAQVAADLTGRIASLMKELPGGGLAPADVVATGAALDVLQTQLAAIGASKRDWIAAQATQHDPVPHTLAAADLHLVQGTDLSKSLGDVALGAPMAAIAQRFGLLVAVSDPSRGKAAVSPTAAPPDHVVLRRSRPVTIGVYRRATGRPGWELDPSTTLAVDVVDEFSQLDAVDLDGSWWRSRNVELAYHPDMSVKTFGVTSTPTATAVVTSLGDVADAVVAARGEDKAAETETRAARTKATLLAQAPEIEALAAARHGMRS
jgi:hypothetical protein